MERCDVLIVGGGPAGSTCAWELGRAGLDVVVADRAVFPRDKPCAGWVTPAALSALELDADDYRRDGRVLQPITGFRTSRLGDREVRTQYTAPVSFGILRREFDHYLLGRSGARPRLGRAVGHLRRVQDGWVLDEELFAPVVVGAGGHFCPVARQLAGPAPAEATVVAQEAEVPLAGAWREECPVQPEAPELFFCPDLAGYGWCVRKGDWLNVGFGRQGERSLPAQVEAFVAFLTSRGRLPADAVLPMKGHAYRLAGSATRPLHGDRFVLAGDAAGLAYAGSGEGIRPAIESGLLAARALLATRGRYGAADLAPYARAVRARYGIGSRGGRFIPAGLVVALGGAVLRSGWATRRLLVERLFLRATEPPLAALPTQARRPAA
jgi:flavin-dependent dehydrogenase